MFFRASRGFKRSYRSWISSWFRMWLYYSTSFCFALSLQPGSELCDGAFLLGKTNGEKHIQAPRRCKRWSIQHEITILPFEHHSVNHNELNKETSPCTLSFCFNSFGSNNLLTIGSGRGIAETKPNIQEQTRLSVPIWDSNHCLAPLPKSLTTHLL